MKKTRKKKKPSLLINNQLNKQIDNLIKNLKYEVKKMKIIITKLPLRKVK